MTQKNETRRTKPTITTYKKTFEDFNQAIEGLKQQNEVIADILPNDEYTIEEAGKAVLEAYSNNFPVLLEKKNIHWSLQLSSNRCSLKTSKSIAFGWDILYKIEDGQAIPLSVSASITFFNDKFDKDFIENCDWELVHK